MKQDYLDLIRQVLDHEVVDANQVACGMVDDLEIEGGPGEGLKVTAILVGPGAWAERLPGLFGLLARKSIGDRKVRVPWEEVDVITERIKLRSEASRLGLGEADRKAARWIERLPGSWKK